MRTIDVRTYPCEHQSIERDKLAAAAILAVCRDKPIKVIRSSADIRAPAAPPVQPPKDDPVADGVLRVLQDTNYPMCSRDIAAKLGHRTDTTYAACLRLAACGRITRENPNGSPGQPAMWSA